MRQVFREALKEKAPPALGAGSRTARLSQPTATRNQ